jgi:hypothetical protein
LTSSSYAHLRHVRQARVAARRVRPSRVRARWHARGEVIVHVVRVLLVVIVVIDRLHDRTVAPARWLLVRHGHTEPCPCNSTM